MATAAEHLEAAFGQAEPEHFAWQTSHPYVGERERELVRAAFLPLGDRVLDLGCGEGATLLHLGAPEGAVGVDLFEPKIAFARRRLPTCRFEVASAERLPFDDGSFDHVLVRDVIHHIEQPEPAIDELARVLAPGGRIDVLEPCRYNPLVALHALTQPAERGELRSTLPYLRALLERRFRVVVAEHLQPVALHRIAFHPRLGSPTLGARERVAKAFQVFERTLGRVVPRGMWTYLHVRAEAR